MHHNVWKAGCDADGMCLCWRLKGDDTHPVRCTYHPTACPVSVLGWLLIRYNYIFLGYLRGFQSDSDVSANSYSTWLGSISHVELHSLPLCRLLRLQFKVERWVRMEEVNERKGEVGRGRWGGKRKVRLRVSKGKEGEVKGNTPPPQRKTKQANKEKKTPNQKSNPNQTPLWTYLKTNWTR